MYVYTNFSMCGCVHVYVCLCANNVVCNRMEDKCNSKKLVLCNYDSEMH